MRWFALPLVFALSACAAKAPEKLRYSDVFRPPEALVEAPAPEKKKKKAKRTKDELAAATSLELQAALIAFAHRSRKHRGGGDDSLTSEQIRNWDDVMTAVDTLLERPPRETSSYDVIRARVTLEAELELDVRAHDRLPTELMTAVELRMARLGYRMAELRRLKVKPNVLRPEFIWPISPVAVTSLYGNRVHPLDRTYRKHNGIDLAAGFGQEVYAAASGTVLVAEWLGGHGNHVKLQHANGVITSYSHLADILVEPGSVVKQGQPVGLAGSTGVSTGVHLHFELWVDGRPEDPLDQLADPSSAYPVAER